MTQDEKERRMLDAARSYNEPPEPPREEMWAAIREALPRIGTVDEPVGAVPGDDDELAGYRRTRARRRLRSWTPWALGLAAAATLAVGFGLGRITGLSEAGRSGAGPAAATRTAAAERGASLTVRMATAEHLGEAEAMLTLYRSTDRSEDRAVTAAWARDLLATTRLLIDSRAGEDPEMARLLGDLELVLVQIASAASDPAEQELIEEGIEERQLLTQIRSATTRVEAAL